MNREPLPKGPWIRDMIDESMDVCINEGIPVTPDAVYAVLTDFRTFPATLSPLRCRVLRVAVEERRSERWEDWTDEELDGYADDIRVDDWLKP